MRIEYIGHSCFKVSSNGYCVILDPYAGDTVPGLAPVAETANRVLCSHRHPDHCGTECVTLADTDACSIKVTAIDSFHDEVQGAKRGANIIHLLDDGAARLAHLGDLGCALTAEQIELLRNVDVLLIPVGGFFTIDAQQAAEIVHQLQPRMVIPMHYRSEAIGYDVIDTVDSFVKRMESVTLCGGSCVDTEEAPQSRVLVLQPRNRR